MNREIILATLEQRLRSPVRLALAAAFVLFATMPYLAAIFVKALPRAIGPSTHGGMLALVFAAGVLGQEFSSGAPQLTFTRPLTRWSWVLSRAFAVGLLASVSAVLPFFAALAIGVNPADVGLGVLEQLAQAIGTTAVVTGLSAIMPGITDLALLAAANIGFNVLGLLGQLLTDNAARTFCARAKEYVEPWFSPKLELVALLHGATFSSHALLVVLSTVAVWLVVAVAMSNRKELSYATD